MAYPKREYKYLVPADRIDALRERLHGMCTLDPYAERTGRGEYTVRSVYFDTRQFDSYHEKVEGVRTRRKFRVRVYERYHAAAVAFLEIKQKEADLLTKFRAPVLCDELGAFFEEQDVDRYVRVNGGGGFEKKNARRFLYHFHAGALRPVVLITYDREAFMGVQNFDLRLTIDKSIRSSFFPALSSIWDEEGLALSLPGAAIMEVKFSRGVPMWLRNAIRDLGLPRKALSKYTICLDAQSSDLSGPGRSPGSLRQLRREAYRKNSIISRP